MESAFMTLVLSIASAIPYIQINTLAGVILLVVLIVLSIMLMELLTWDEEDPDERGKKEALALVPAHIIILAISYYVAINVFEWHGIY